MKLQSIAKEAAACRAAFAAMPDAIAAWHLHHEDLAEPLREPAENRIAYILTDKPEEEQALRLRLFRPIVGPLPSAYLAAYDKANAAYGKAWAAYVKAWAASDKAWAASVKAWAASVKAWAAYDFPALHAAECLDCPWDGRSIFG